MIALAQLDRFEKKKKVNESSFSCETFLSAHFKNQ